MKYLPSILTGVFTVTSLYAANAARISISDIWIPFVAAILIGAFFTLLFSLNKWTAKSAPFIASIWTAVFLLWNLVSPAVSVVFLVMSIFIGVKFNTRQTVKYIGIGAIFAIYFTFGQIAWVGAQNLKFDTNEPATYITPQGKPNIYFIVPDRMPGIDAMKETGIATAELEDGLSNLGFYIKPDQQSHDPYTATTTEKLGTTRTMRFFASVLNDGMEIPIYIRYKDCKKLIQNPAVAVDLHYLGYTFINIEAWFAETAGINADVKLRFDKMNLFDRIFTGEFNTAFWERTVIAGLNFKKLLPAGAIVQNEQARQLWQAETLKEYSMKDGQNFVMAHILLPHEPFVWTADGQPQYAKLPDTELYKAQIEFTQGYLLDLAQSIRENDPTGIIIIQADEGMAYRDAELSKQLSPSQWNGVLTAWYIPNACYSCLEKMDHTKILNYVLGTVK